MASMRRRLLLAVLLGTLLALGGGAWWLSRALADELTDEFDAALLARAESLVALTEQEDGQIELDYEPRYFSSFHRERHPEHFQFWLDDGRVLLRSPRLEGDLPNVGPLVGPPTYHDAVLSNGRAVRVVRIPFLPRGPGPDDENEAKDGTAAVGADLPVRSVVLAVARGRERLDGLLGRLGMGLLVGGVLVLLAAGLLAWRGIARGLAPLDDLAAQVGALDADSLDQRVVLADPPRELQPVVEQLNALLVRLDASLARERRFAGNVAHELRTPIAELRSLATVGGQWPEDAEGVRGFFGDVDAIATRMEHVIADLLLLARCHAGIERLDTAPVDVRALLMRASDEVSRVAADRGLAVDLDVPDALVVESDEGKLAIVFANLLGNAATYARPGTTIHCRARAAGDGLALVVENDAAPLPIEALARLDEPFWRADAARSAEDHAGLGLSLVSALCLVLGLEARFSQSPDGRFRVALAPRSERTSPPAEAGIESAAQGGPKEGGQNAHSPKSQSEEPRHGA